MKKILFSFVLLCSLSAFSQEELDSYGLFMKRSKETLDANFVEGEWQSLDSIGVLLRFVHSEKGLELMAGEIYYFIPKDSLSGFSPIGIFAHWPPDYCYVKRLDENTIEVEFDDYTSIYPGPRQFRRLKKT